MVDAGKFITFEGGEGTGKSTQVALLAERLRKAAIRVIKTREPGGTPGAEVMRHLLKSGAAKPLGAFTEAIIVSAARDDHLTQLIRPALKDGKWVICDRFADSTRVYQGAAGGLDPALVNSLERMIVGENRPDITFLMDAPVEEGIKRTQDRSAEAGEIDPIDRFDQEGIEFHKKLRDAFLKLARGEPDRFIVIDATGSKEDIAEDIWAAIKDRLLA